MGLALLVTDCVTSPELPRYTAQSASELVGVELDQFLELWASFGFPKAEPDDVYFTPGDVEAFRDLVGVYGVLGLNDREAAAFSRVIGSATSRVAEAGQSTMAALRGDVEDAGRAEEVLATADAVVPGVARLLDFAWRRHLQAAAKRAMLSQVPVDPADPLIPATVGFADMTGFTVLSHQLTGAALEDLTRDFASMTNAVVNDGGGRVVKMIGDEVMFVVSDPADAVDIGVELVDAVSHDELLSELKVGIDWGFVLARDGDYYGHPVNTASRIVRMTRPGSVVVTDEVRVSTDRHEPVWSWAPLGRQYVRDVGWVRLWAARRYHDQEPDPDGARPQMAGLWRSGAAGRWP